MTKRYLIYRNLNNGKFSIKDPKTGLVVAHSDNLKLEDCRFKVSQSGRKRAVETGQRNVHAYIEAGVSARSDLTLYKGRTVETIFDFPMPTLYERRTGVHYNPFRDESFVDDEGNALERAPVILMSTSPEYSVKAYF